MKILHLGLVSHYTEGMTYQDNFISDINSRHGNEVIYISDNYLYKGNEIIEVQEEDKNLKNNVRLIRVKHDKILNKFITSKIQKVKKLNIMIQNMKPDCILYHGVCGYELMTVAKYKKTHPELLFYVDSHEDFNNTAKNILSKFAYKYIHGYFLKKALPYINKILYISEESKDYLVEMYDLNEKMLEWFPLGGTIVSEEVLRKNRQEVFKKLNFDDNVIVFGHSGKLDRNKKTRELIRAFSSIKNPTFRLIIFGSIPNEEQEELISLIESDSRIVFLGWQNDTEILKLLSAIDMYCQPGTQSATMQNAMCCKSALMLYPYKSHVIYLQNNGYFVKDEIEIMNVFENISNNPSKLIDMKNESYNFASKFLDYEKLSARIYR